MKARRRTTRRSARRSRRPRHSASWKRSRAVLERGDEPTYALVAEAAGCQERTVYRHFPTREDLVAAFWDWQYSILGPRTGPSAPKPSCSTSSDRAFRGFDEHPELITAMLHTRHGRAARLSENDQRRAMAERCVDDAVPGLDRRRRRQAAAATQLLFSAAAWEVLRDYWDMDGEQAAATASLALTSMLEGLRRSSTADDLRTHSTHTHPNQPERNPTCCSTCPSPPATPSECRESSPSCSAPASSTAPSPPFPAGAKFVCAFDEAGTMVEIVPAGIEYVPGPGNRTDMVVGAHVERTPVHGSFTTPLTAAEALAIAEREGWPCGLIDNGPFQVINVWLEGTQLLELFPSDLVDGYLALYGPAGRDILDPGLRALEASLRG